MISAAFDFTASMTANAVEISSRSTCAVPGNRANNVCKTWFVILTLCFPLIEPSAGADQVIPNVGFEFFDELPVMPGAEYALKYGRLSDLLEARSGRQMFPLFAADLAPRHHSPEHCLQFCKSCGGGYG
jgi:hypothetical protein